MLASQSPINERGEAGRADGGAEMFSISAASKVKVQGQGGDDRVAQKKTAAALHRALQVKHPR